jgi:hypothetical protein
VMVDGNGSFSERVRTELLENQDQAVMFTQLVNDEHTGKAWEELDIDDLKKAKKAIQDLRDAVEVGDLNLALNMLANLVELELEKLAAAVSNAIKVTEKIHEIGMFD